MKKRKKRKKGSEGKEIRRKFIRDLQEIRPETICIIIRP